ncbi:hypothetical protein [Prosthecomicrobium hirschii]|uniref:hypothetical protein n=1 Tax=Prosthecodimorpha hirschii TaxID=665126 RepID=UPI002220E9BA|nr:hypothetical protein [Prosthecomicrobium hirschii]MCW1838749.1 hypothetical protein [Prosthecomicrobium hirschii]
MTAKAKAVTTVPSFPSSEVAKKLADELVVSVKDLATIQGIGLPAIHKELLEKAIHIDSHTIVEILCVLDQVVGFEVGQDAVRPGGYNSIEEAVTDVTARVGKLWAKHYTEEVAS